MTQAPVRLIPLSCIRCQGPIQAQPDEVAWVCEQCGQGLLLSDEKGLVSLDVFFSKEIQPGSIGKPLWVVRGTTQIKRRETYKGDEMRAAQDFWSSPKLFYIPAWETSLDEVVSRGVALLLNPIRMETGPAARFLPVTTPREDLSALAEFMVVSIEADRKDAMKSIDFALSLEPAQLWIMK